MENQKKVFDGMQMYFCEYIKKYVYLCPDTLTEQYFNGISPFPDVPEAFFYLRTRALVGTYAEFFQEFRLSRYVRGQYQRTDLRFEIASYGAEFLGDVALEQTADRRPPVMVFQHRRVLDT